MNQAMNQAMIITRFAALALVALLAAACTNNTAPSALPQFRITDVNVSVAPNVKPNSNIAAAVSRDARRVASAYSVSLPQGLPGRTLNVRVTKIGYKNAVASLLVGSANGIEGTAAVPNQTPRAKIAYLDGQSAAVNGVIGAIAAARADKSLVDAKLARGLAEKAVAHAYGQTSTPKFARDNLSAR